MHDQSSTGNDFFKCDFCRRPWAEDRPRVEGHQGSLICSSCLSAAYAAVALAGTGAELAGTKCTMCLEQRKDPMWRSPLSDDAVICRRCIKQSATTLEKDEELGWKRPADPTAAGGAGPTASPDEDDDEHDDHEH